MTVRLIYSATTGRLRSIQVPLGPATLGPGEASTTMSDAQYQAGNDPQAAVNAVTGLVPTNDRFAIVDANGFVVGALLADPVGCGDAVAGASLIAHGSAGPGWFRESSGRWTPRLAPRRRIIRRRRRDPRDN